MPSGFPSILFVVLSHAVALGQPDVYKDAIAKFQDGQLDAALRLAERAVQTNGKNPQYLHLSGSILAAMGRLDAAERYLRQADAIAPQQLPFAFDLGTLLHNERKYPEAVPVLKRAVRLAPENLVARMMLARCYVFSFHELKLPDFVDRTLEQLDYIAKKDPKFPAVHHHLALVYINTGDLAKAERELDLELRLFPENAQARLELGETLLKLNENRKAIDQLQIAAKQAPQVPPIYFALAKAYRAEGDAGKALEAVEHCVALDPQFPTCHYMLGQLYREMNRIEQADEQFEQFKRLRRTDGAPN
jgi:predicted Zn-dependent protease